jgi:hypothetical protein
MTDQTKLAAEELAALNDHIADSFDGNEYQPNGEPERVEGGYRVPVRTFFSTGELDFAGDEDTDGVSAVISEHFQSDECQLDGEPERVDGGCWVPARVWVPEGSVSYHDPALAEIVKELAEYSRESGASVDVDSAYGTVCISARGEDDIFFQGDEAEQFTAAVDALERQVNELDRETIELAVAKPYIENLWG